MGGDDGDGRGVGMRGRVVGRSIGRRVLERNVGRRVVKGAVWKICENSVRIGGATFWKERAYFYMLELTKGFLVAELALRAILDIVI